MTANAAVPFALPELLALVNGAMSDGQWNDDNGTAHAAIFAGLEPVLWM